MPRVKRFTLWLIICLLLAACQPVSRGPDRPLFVPPTQEGAVSGAAASSGETGPSSASGQGAGTAPASPSQPTVTVQCRDNLAFIKDVTIPDGTSVAPDSTLDKRWEVENNGNCNWSKGYRIRLIAGPELGAQKEQALYPARSGSHAVMRVVFKAPLEPGTYRSAWQAFNPKGEAFGDPFFIEIKVETP